MLYRHVVVLWVSVAVSSAAMAETIALVTDQAPVAIHFGQTREFQFGTVSRADATVLLKIKSRMDFPRLGGSMQFMHLKLNDWEVRPAVGRSAQRLLNRPFCSPVTPTLSENWFVAGGPGSVWGWKVINAPDFQAAHGEKYYVGDPYEIVLDVTDLINPVAENRLTIENTATAAFVARSVTPATHQAALDLVIGSLQIETRPGASPMMAVPDAMTPVINRGEPGAGPAGYHGEVLPGGGLAVHVGRSTYQFASSFSYPDAGFNQLAAGPPATGGQSEWQVAVAGNHATATGLDYTIVRTVDFGPRRIAIADAVTNLHKEAPLGLCVRHELALGALKDAPIRLAGNPDPAVSDYISYGNPTVHIVTPEGGLGLLVEDDVFRNQAHLYVQSNEQDQTSVAGLRTEMLRLGPGETYTLKWAIYSVAGPDFYDFINLVRADWGANYTAEGVWLWGFPGDLSKMSPDEIQAVVKHEGMRVSFAPDWVEWAPNERGTQRIGYGTDVLSDYWAGRRAANLAYFEKLKQACPEARVQAYYNSMRESSDDTLTRFADSLMLNSAGQPIRTIWTHIGAKNPTWAMVPTLTNSYGRTMLDVARRYMDDMRTDGIYWDEAEGIQFNHILITEQHFDGHSCLLDLRTWRIQREVGIVPLVTRPFQDAVVHLVQQRGGPLLVNGPTGSSQTLRDHVQRMTEAQQSDEYGYQGLLQTPLAYMSWQDGWDNFLRVLGLGLLPVVRGARVLPHDISPHLTPFTPIELHAGYLLGKERIIATHSGSYGWAGERALARVCHFNSAGKLGAGDFVTAVGTEARTKVALLDREAVVLERLPLSFLPGQSPGAEAEVSEIQYRAREVTVRLAAPRGGVLTVRAGEFPVREGVAVTLHLGGTSRSLAPVKEALVIPVPAGFSDTVRLTP